MNSERVTFNMQPVVRVLLHALAVSTLLLLCSCEVKYSCKSCGGSGTKFWGQKCSACSGSGSIKKFSLGRTIFLGGLVCAVLVGFSSLVAISEAPGSVKSKNASPRSIGQGGDETEYGNHYLHDREEHHSMFIIGPEGAGKTVFLAALARFVDAHSDEFVFQSSDFDSSQYAVNTLKLLDRGKWPKSNPQGEFKILRWRLGKVGEELYKVVLFDYSGQDMRTVLLEDDVSKLEGQPMEIRAEIDQSDLMIYLLDMDGLIGSLEANENVWLLKTFLTHPDWVNKQRILVVTKAELYREMIQESGDDLRETIGRQLISIPTLEGAALRSELKNVECYALTAVVTQTELIDDAAPIRLPKKPLVSEGFYPLIQGILSALGKV